MKRTLILIALVFPAILFAQTVTVSEPISIRNDIAYELIGKMKGRTLLYRDKETTFEIQAFDHKMRLSWKKDLELDKRRPSVIGLVPGNDEFNIIYQFKSKNGIVAKVHRYDAAANLKDSTTIVDYGKKYFVPSAKMIYSENKKVISIYHVEKSIEMYVTTFDLDRMEVLWEQKFMLEDMNAQRTIKRMLVDNRGGFNIIFEKDNKKIQKENHRFEVLYYGNDVNAPEIHKIPMSEYLTYDVHFVFDNLNRNLLAAGLYSESNRGHSDGFFFLKIPHNDPNSYTKVFEEFTDKFLTDVLGKDKKRNKGIADASIQEIVLRKDGGILIVGEENRHTERNMSTARSYVSGSSVRNVVDYFYEDIFLVSIHPDGEVHWNTILHKKQYSQNDDAMFSSFFLLKTPSNLRFLFNDEIKYENTVSEYVVNGIGNFDRNSILSTEDQKLRLRFRDAIQVAANELIVPSENRNKLKLIKVTF